MAERSFAREVEDLKLGDGDIFRGEGILAITKALLQSGVSYVGGYQGSPISHLMDVLADAKDVLDDLGVHFESSASEAAAAAMLSASVHYPVRGAVTWKSTAGTNVASDALSNLSSGGVKGGALIVIGEDYGEGSSIMQERSHAYAMKSQMWLLDPAAQPRKRGQGRRRRLRLVGSLEHARHARSAHPNLPRARGVRREGQPAPAVHAEGRGREPPARSEPHRAAARGLRPREGEARGAVARRGRVHQGPSLNEHFGPATGDIGIIVQGGMYNNLMRALQYLGLADIYGDVGRADLRLERHLSVDRRRGARFCLGKTGRHHGGGRTARIYRTVACTPCCDGATSRRS